MVGLLILAGLLAGAAPRAAAQDPIVIDHEDWRVIGWNDGCGVAYARFSYPKLGEAIAAEPVSTRVGTAVIPPSQEKAVERWTLEEAGRLSWDERAVAAAEKALRASGFARRGYPEVLRDAAVGRQPGLAETLLSTTTLASRLKTGWPGPDWRWAGGSYNPLGTCALLAFENRAAPRRYRFLLTRVYNPRARLDRAYAHVSNARLLFDAGDLDGSFAEARGAADLAPEMALARYEHAALLALTGRTDEAVAELGAALKLDPKMRAQAREDADFADLRERDDFRELTAGSH